MKKFKVQKRDKGWRAKRLVRNKIGYMKYKTVVCSDCLPDDKNATLWFGDLEDAINHLKFRYYASKQDIKIEE